MKRFITTILVSVMLISLCSSNIYATEDTNKEEYKYYSKDEIDDMINDIATEAAQNEYSGEIKNTSSIEMQKKELIEKFQKVIKKQQNSRVPTYDNYKSSSPTIKYANIKGKASGQPTKGYTRKKGDLLFWNPSGGTTVSVGVSFGYKSVSVSGSLGYGGTSSIGSGFTCPSNGNFYIYAHKIYKVTQANLWGHPYNSPAGTWVRIDSAPQKSYYGDETYLAKY